MAYSALLRILNEWERKMNDRTTRVRDNLLAYALQIANQLNSINNDSGPAH